MQIILNQHEVEVAIRTYIEDHFPIDTSDLSISVSEEGTATILVGEEVHEDTPPVGVEKKTRRSRKNPQEAKHRLVEPEPKETAEEVKVEEIQTSTGGQNENSTPEHEQEVAEPDAQEEVVQEEEKAEEPAEKPTAKPSLFAGLKRS